MSCARFVAHAGASVFCLPLDYACGCAIDWAATTIAFEPDRVVHVAIDVAWHRKLCEREPVGVQSASFRRLRAVCPRSLISR